MRYASIRSMDVSNGEGVGVALFVQGCHFHCKDCFNQETWDFSGGKEWTEEVENKFMELVSRPFIKRVSILGGEPLADENVKVVRKLVERIKEKFPEKIIWIYTGYTWKEIEPGTLMRGIDKESNIYNARSRAVSTIDVLVDGRYKKEERDVGNRITHWAGSTNQRIIDVQKSLAAGRIIEKV